MLTQVAVCTRWLRGRCTRTPCHLTHKIEPAKMPVCSYFLQVGSLHVVPRPRIESGINGRWKFPRHQTAPGCDW
jgi:hypothetical protein